MIGFLLNIDALSFRIQNLKISINPKLTEENLQKNQLSIYYLKQISFITMSNNRFDFFFLGDLILSKNQKLENICMGIDGFNSDELRKLRGHFYLIIIDKLKENITFYNSLFSILPIYYLNKNNNIIISSSIDLIKKSCTQKLTINKKFIVEKLLFNYAFLDDTIYNETKLVPSNHYLRINPKIEIIKHIDIENYFTQNPQKWRDTLDPISELFTVTLSNYFPNAPFYLTLTGGFDGRTLMGYALKEKLDFNTFSYGSSSDKDIQIPAFITQKIGKNHTAYILDERYAKHDYIHSLEKVINSTDCNASLTRSYYSHIASELTQQVDYILSGNFGSEILRIWRIPGVMTSEFLLKSFGIDEIKTLKDVMEHYPSLEFLRKEEYSIELEEVLEQLIRFKGKYPKNLNSNQIFYIYFFEQIFRKYFGAELVIQNSHSLFNRTPFIDFEFLTEILKTELSGANGRYLERNPFLRFKGQILYSYILKRIKSPLIDFPTDRGYMPKDFFSLRGKANIVHHYLNNNVFNKKDKNYSQYNELCFQMNRQYFSSLKIPNDLFNVEKITEQSTKLRTDLSQVLSMIIYINKFL